MPTLEGLPFTPTLAWGEAGCGMHLVSLSITERVFYWFFLFLVCFDGFAVKAYEKKEDFRGPQATETPAKPLCFTPCAGWSLIIGER